MALSNAPFGLMPQDGVTNTPYIQYPIYAGEEGVDGSLNANIFTGDPVRYAVAGDGANTSGTIAPITPNATYANAANNVPVIGVFLGCEYFAPDGMYVRSRMWRAGTAVKPGTVVWANIARDPNIQYKIQVSCMDAGADLAEAIFDQIQMSQNFAFGLGAGNELNNPATGNLATGKSAIYLNAVGTGATDYTIATLPLKTLVFATDQNIYLEDGSISPFVHLLVKINNHIEHAGVAGFTAY